MPQGERCKVRCRAKPGTFSDELVVRIETTVPAGEAQCLAYEGSVDSLGAPDDDGEFEGAIHAYCLGRQEGVVAVVLPQSTFQNGSSIVVKESQLV